MPDGDRVHSHLRQPYQRPNQILCQGVASSEDCARSVLMSLKKDLQQTSKWALVFSRDIADLFSQGMGPLGFSNDVEAARISRQINELINQASATPRENWLVDRVAKTVLNELRYGLEIDGCNIQSTIFERYIREKYEAEFKEQIPLSRKHHTDVSDCELQRRIDAMEPYLVSGIRQFAKAAIKSQNLDKLRLPQCQFHRGVDLDENLLAS